MRYRFSKSRLIAYLTPPAKNFVKGDVVDVSWNAGHREVDIVRLAGWPYHVGLDAKIYTPEI